MTPKKPNFAEFIFVDDDSNEIFADAKIFNKMLKLAEFNSADAELQKFCGINFCG